MRRVCAILLACGTFAPCALAGDHAFAEIVGAISSEYHARPVHIPFFGLAKTVVFVARPAGTRQIDIAIFEDLETEGHDSAALARRISEMAAPGWKPFVQVRSNVTGETTLVFVQSEKAGTRLLVAALQRREATVVQLKVNPDALRRWLDDPAGEIANTAPRGGESEP